MQHFNQKTTVRIAVVMLVTIAVVSFILNVVSYHASIGKTLIGDAAFYFRTGQNMALGLGYTFDGRTPTCGYSIGYPMFITTVAIFFPDDINAIYIAQMILSYVTLIFLYLVMKRHFKNMILRLIPLLLYVMNYKIIQFNCSILSECFSLFVLAIFLFTIDVFFAKKRIIPIIIAAALFALLSLVRPVYMYFAFVFPFLLLVYGLLRKQIYVLEAFVFFVVVFLLLSPMLVRNRRLFGGYKLAFNGGAGLFQGTYIPYDGMWHDWAKKAESNSDTLSDLFSQMQDKGINERDDILRKEGIRNIQRNGLRGVPLYLKNMSKMLFAFPYYQSLQKLPVQRKFYMLLNLLSIGLLVFGLIFVARRCRTFNLFVVFVYLLFAYYTLFHVFIANTPRYGFPALMLSYVAMPFALKRFFDY